MLKLRKPFSRKVKLHIRQDLLQKLWDQYVPESSAEYGRIELIYTDAKDVQAEAQPRQVQLLVHLVLRNRILKAGLSDLRTVPAAGRRQMENSVRRAEKCFLTQLRCYDVRLFRTVSRYVTLLEQAEKDGRRYQGWQRENRSIEKQWAEYRLFSAFSSEVKNFLMEHSVETARKMERELIRVLPENEYGLLAERIPGLAEPKDFMLQYVDVMETEEIRQLWKQLEEFSQEPQEQMNANGLWEKMWEFHVRYGQEVARGFRERVSSILNKESYQMVSKPYREMMDMVRNAEPYQEADDRTTAGLDQGTADMAVVPKSDQEALGVGNRLEKDPVSQIYQTMERVQWKLEEQKERIWQREERAFETYRELYEDALAGQNLTGRQKETGRLAGGTSETGQLVEGASEKGRLTEEVLEAGQLAEGASEKGQLTEGTFEAARLENVRRFVEGLFQSQHQGEMSEGELRDICEWGRVFAELFAKSFSEKMDSGKTVKEVAGYADRYDEEWVYLTQEISRYIEGQDREPEDILKSGLMKEQGLGNLLEKIHVLDEGRRTEFVRSLSDMIRIWIQVSPSKSEKLGTGKPVRQVVQEVFQSERQREMSGEELQELCEWGSVIAGILTEPRPEEQKPEYLMEEIIHNIEGQSVEPFLRRWKENVSQEGLGNLLEKLRILDEEKRTEFVRRLSDILRIWVQVSTSEQFVKLEPEKEGKTFEPSAKSREESVWQAVEADFRNSCEKEMSREEFRELCEWGRILVESVSEPWKEVQEPEGEGMGEGIGQTNEDVRQMRFHDGIWEEAGYHAEMVYLVGELNRYLGDGGQGAFSTAWQEQVIENGLKDQGLRNLLESLHVLDKERRTEFVRSLSDSIHIWNQVSLPEPSAQAAETRDAKEWLPSGGTRLADVSFRKLWEWGEALQNISDHHEVSAAFLEKSGQTEKNMIFSEESSQREKHLAFSEQDPESGNRKEFSEEDSLRELIRQIHHKMAEGQEAPGAVTEEQTEADDHSFQLLYMDGQLESPPIQSLLRYVRKLDEEQYEIFIRELSQITQIQWKLSLGQGMEEEAERELRQILIQRNRRLLKPGHERRLSGADEAETADVPYLRMWEWGEALLFYPEYAQDEKAKPMESAGEKAQTAAAPEEPKAKESVPTMDDSAHAAASAPEERGRKQTEWIRRQIEEGKDRNNLQQLIGQINHRLFFTQKKEEGETKPDETLQLIYADSQLSVPSIRSLLHYIRNLDEGGYGELVKKLAQVTKVQSMLSSGTGYEEQTAREVKQMVMQRKTDIRISAEADYNSSLPESRTLFSKVWEWGKALLYYPEQGQGWKELDAMPQAQKRALPAEGIGQDDQDEFVYTEFITDRSNLQQMIRQMNHLAVQQSVETQQASGLEQKPKAELDREKDQKPEAGRDRSLAYTSGQLETPAVQDLLYYIRRLDEEQYGILIEELAKVTSIQQRMAIERKEVKADLEPAELRHRVVPVMEKLPEITKNQPGIMQSMENQPGIMQSMENQPDMERLAGIPGAGNQPDMPGIENRADMENLSGIRGTESQPVIQSTGNQPQDVPAQGRISSQSQGRREGYPELAHRIMQYEVQRRHTTGRNLRQLKEAFAYPAQSGRISRHSADMAPIFSADGRFSPLMEFQVPGRSQPGRVEPGEPVLPEKALFLEEAVLPEEIGFPAVMEQPEGILYQQPERILYQQPEGEPVRAQTSGQRFPHRQSSGQSLVRLPGQAANPSPSPGSGYPVQELAYSMPDTDTSREEQRRAELRLREENVQIKSVQEQLGRKLTEVEKQLKAVEGTAKAKEDVRAFADQVKRQLYEELHVEKLRRGLI